MRLHSHRLFVSRIAIFLLVGAGMASHSEAADFQIAVKKETRAFTPQEITIKAGDEVMWVNDSDEKHFLTSAGSSDVEVVSGTEHLMIHKLMHPGDSYMYTFTKPETYFYFCAIHLNMWGTINVK